MKIEFYISQLLYRYQCVVVPGFGAFLTSMHSAEVNVFNNTFFPPKKSVSFNSQIKNNDGLLANHIAVNEKITFENAVSIIDNQLQDWKNILKNNQQLVLDNIGNLVVNSNNNIIFTENNDNNYETGSFGLSTFSSPLIKREVVKEIIATETQTPVAEVTPIQIEQYQPKPNYFKYAAAIVVGLGAFGIIGQNVYNNQIAEYNQLAQLEVQKEVVQKIEQATFFIDIPKSITNTTIADADMRFHIMAGSFRSDNNANKIFAKLSNLGFKPKMLAKTNVGLTPVLYGSYPTFASAQLALDQIQKTHNPDAWMMIKKL